VLLSIPARPCAACSSRAPTIPDRHILCVALHQCIAVRHHGGRWELRTSSRWVPTVPHHQGQATYLIESNQIIDGATITMRARWAHRVERRHRHPRTRGTFTWIGLSTRCRSEPRSTTAATCTASIRPTDRLPAADGPNPHCYVASFTYLDMYGQYEFSKQLRMTATVSNVTNRLAPLIRQPTGNNYNRRWISRVPSAPFSNWP